MKKLIGIIISFTLVLTLVACGGSKPETPEQAFNNALKAVKNLDEVEMKKYFDENIIEEQLEDNEDLIEENMEHAKLIVDRLQYEVLSSTVDGDTAIINAKITNIDMQEVVSEYFVKALALAFSGKDEDVMEEEMEAMMVEMLTKEDINLTSADVKVNLRQGEDNWIIDPDEEFMDAVLGGLLSLADMFEQ